MLKVYIFYDGHCVLCDSFIRFVWHNDTKGVFYFVPVIGLASITVFAKGRVYTKSDAVCCILKHLGILAKMTAYILSAIPKKIRNTLYDYIARFRYHMGNKTNITCPTIDPKLRKRFILEED